jgi:UDP-2,4-diacetamido-2,4,6-trideoxy-beta-L-altropyranose hydrolase
MRFARITKAVGDRRPRRPASCCDLLLDQNLGRAAIDYAKLVPEHCTVLAGPQFALLRPEFAALREYSLQRRETPALRHLLITMGGVDQPNATGQVLEALKTCPLPDDCKITVVMGGKAPWLEQVREIAATMPWPTEVTGRHQRHGAGHGGQ